jgi:virulence factor Mce-like protein
VRRQTPLNAAFRNPTVIGALAVLITILAVFLAYNANNGLPFVQSYRLTAQVPNAAALVPGNEVRIGGVRVGIVESIEPVATEDGTYAAQLALKLDKSVEPLPEDSTVIIRSRSALGLKYVQITRGTSDQGYPAGSVLPLSAARPEPVEFDQLLSTFDKPTQKNIQANLTEFGNALAGRGPDINAAIGALKPLLPRLERVARDISDPQTGIGPFFTALAQSASEVAPVAQTQAQMFVDLDTTLAAFADVARPYLQETISKTPVTLRTASDTLPRIRPFLVNSRKLFVDLQPGTAAAAVSADTIAAALRAGIPVLRASPQLNDQLPPTAAALRRFNDDTVVRSGLTRLIDLSNSLKSPLRFIAPAQSVCNYATLLLRNGADATSVGNPTGNWQRANAVGSPTGPNSEGSPSSAPANGGGGSSDPKNLNFLHVNPYPNTAAPGQSPTECEAGNEPYVVGRQVIGNVPGNQGIKTEDQIGFQLRKGGGG